MGYQAPQKASAAQLPTTFTWFPCCTQRACGGRPSPRRYML